MPEERLPEQASLLEALLDKANGRRSVGRPRTRWTNYLRMGVREDRAVQCGCPRSLHGKKGNEERRIRVKNVSKFLFFLVK